MGDVIYEQPLMCKLLHVTKLVLHIHIQFCGLHSSPPPSKIKILIAFQSKLPVKLKLHFGVSRRELDFLALEHPFIIHN